MQLMTESSTGSGCPDDDYLRNAILSVKTSRIDVLREMGDIDDWVKVNQDEFAHVAPLLRTNMCENVGIVCVAISFFESQDFLSFFS